MIVSNPDFEAIAAKYGVTAAYAKQVWYDLWEYIHDEATSFRAEEHSDEELKAMKTDFYLPHFGLLRLNMARLRMHRPYRLEDLRKMREYGRYVPTTAELKANLAAKRRKLFTKSLHNEGYKKDKGEQREEDSPAVHESSADL